LAGTAICRPPAIGGAPEKARWIWYPEGNPAKSAPPGRRYFRRTVQIPAGAKIKSARMYFNVDDSGILYVNSKQAGRTTGGWNKFDVSDITSRLRPGKNVLAVEATNSTGPAGLIGWLSIRLTGGKKITVPTDSGWKAFKARKRAWHGVKFDDSAWAQAENMGPLGMGPWGRDIKRPGSEIAFEIKRDGTGPVSADKARELIELDWLCQAENGPSAQRSLWEIARSRKIAARLSLKHDSLGFEKELAELAGIEKTLKAALDDMDDEAAAELYLAVRRIKRRVMFRNPLLDFDSLLLLDTPVYSGVHESSHRNGYRYGNRSGSRLLVLEGLRPDGRERVLLPPETGYIMRMDLSFDAKKIVFGMKEADKRSFHLYEVGIDGKGLRQLTNSPYDDMDPIYLPDGHILFSTSRSNTYVRCLPPSASTVLARCDKDGRNIYIISRNNEPDYTPSLLDDGRVLYTRWEYTERPLWRLQKLWTINQDGTGEAVYWGNSSAYPDMLWEARQIPGTGKVIFAAVGHHNVVTGCIGIIDISRGREYPRGIHKVTAEVRWPEVGDPKGKVPVASENYHAGGGFWSYRCPYPLGPEDFLVAGARLPNGRFDLYLMDIHGNRELIYVGLHNAWYARPFRRRPMPELNPDRIRWPRAGEKPEDGVLFSSNVYRGVEGLPKGKAKYLRVIQMDSKTYSFNFKSWRHSGPAISVIQEDGVKRILGTAPIHEDGSVAFKVPAGQALHFQLLDENRRCIQIMRSFTGVMQGEIRGCLGCHGLHSASPHPGSSKVALRRDPVELTPPPWGADVSISYERFCQPVIDKYCGKCHQGDGKGRKKLDLTLRGGIPERGITDPKMYPFKEPYLTLVGQAWGAPPPAGKGKGLGLAGCLNVERYRNYGPLKPMTMLSSTSPLIKMVMSGKHNKVRIEGEDLLRLIAWVDCNCVYRGDEEVRQIPDPKKSDRTPVPFRTRTAPRINRLEPVNDPMPPEQQPTP
jgi:hypothetical protein